MGIELLDVRNAIRTCCKIVINLYRRATAPIATHDLAIATVYYVDVTWIAAWCELRGVYRYFRADRIVQSEVLEERYAADSSPMMAEWMAKRSQKSGLLRYLHPDLGAAR
ncbi:MAG: WYL domain-containing protein [Mesorhizobium sp.]|uniref:WYL domain-containing protein n=1 Tax=Mesorhizobium sp. TaxID=1871066 RepID=UPI001217F3BB|nr:WYL domain-containing protein [Mesorhizobium sp.]TIQ16798.1 MAG: WYL domain-containing protein [Mesorhizobium sp.]